MDLHVWRLPLFPHRLASLALHLEILDPCRQASVVKLLLQRLALGALLTVSLCGRELTRQRTLTRAPHARG